MWVLLQLAVVALIGTWVQVCLGVVAARPLGVSLARVSFGTGPALLTRAVGRVDVQLGALPLGGFAEPSEPPQPARMAAWLMSGPLGLLLVAVVLVPAGAPTAFAATFGQWALGAWSPLDHGAVLLEQAVDAAGSVGARTLVGLVWAKLAAFNVLVSMPQAAIGLLPERARVVPQLAWLLVLLATALSWCAALGAALLR